MKIALLVAGILLTGLVIALSMLYLSDPTPDDFQVDRELFPYQPHYLQTNNGARVHYVDEGQGPTLLLLHGNPTWSFLYRDLIAELKYDFRLIAPDYPGFGLSTAPLNYHFTPAEHAQAISELVQQLELTDVVIMVQDWGGPIGFEVALNNPERIKGFVIGNTWAWPLERTGHKIFSTIMGGWPGQFSEWCCNGIVRLFMSRGVATHLTDDELAMYLAPFAAREQRSQVHIFPAQLWDASAFLGRIHQRLPSLSDRPVLLTWGMKDFAFKDPERNRFESIFPNHETVLLDNSGHFIQEDAPHEIATAIRVWLQQHR